MEIDSQKLKKLFTKKYLSKVVFEVFLRRIKFIVLIVSTILLIFCVYIWYRSIYAPGWSEARKQEYIKNKDKGVAFNKSGFQDVVSEYQKRKEETDKPIENNNDIFRLKK